MEIDCPADCPHLVDGQKYQQEKIARRRLKKEGAGTYIRRAGLYTEHPELFLRIERTVVELFRSERDMSDTDVRSAFELVLQTLETQKSGLIYEHSSTSSMVNELSGRLVHTLLEYKDGSQSATGTVTLDFVKDVVSEFKNEVEFYIDLHSNAKSYLKHIARYHPVKETETDTQSRLIIT